MLNKYLWRKKTPQTSHFLDLIPLFLSYILIVFLVIQPETHHWLIFLLGSVLVRVLQRSRTKRKCREKGRDSCDEGGRQGPGSAVSKSETCESRWWGPSVEVGGFRPKKVQRFRSSPKAGKGCRPSSAARQEEFSFRRVGLLLYSGLQLIGWGSPTLGRAPASLSPRIQMLISTKNSLTETPRIMLDQMSGHPETQSSGHIKLTSRSPFWLANKSSFSGEELSMQSVSWQEREGHAVEGNGREVKDGVIQNSRWWSSRDLGKSEVLGTAQSTWHILPLKTSMV